MLHGLLDAEQILCHPFVIGEVATGSVRDREEVLYRLELLPQPIKARDFEVLRFISEARLFGLGVGYIDLHLLVAVKLTRDSRLWTRDKRLLVAARGLGLAFEAS